MSNKYLSAVQLSKMPLTAGCNPTVVHLSCIHLMIDGKPVHSILIRLGNPCVASVE